VIHLSRGLFSYHYPAKKSDLIIQPATATPTDYPNPPKTIHFTYEQTWPKRTKKDEKAKLHSWRAAAAAKKQPTKVLVVWGRQFL